MLNIVIGFIVGIIFIGIICGALVNYLLEKKEFNEGYCPHCGEKLTLFSTDSQGGRGYVCDNCLYTAWISYPSIDRKGDKE